MPATTSPASSATTSEAARLLTEADLPVGELQLLTACPYTALQVGTLLGMKIDREAFRAQGGNGDDLVCKMDTADDRGASRYQNRMRILAEFRTQADPAKAYFKAGADVESGTKTITSPDGAVRTAVRDKTPGDGDVQVTIAYWRSGVYVTVRVWETWWLPKDLTTGPTDGIVRDPAPTPLTADQLRRVGDQLLLRALKSPAINLG